MLSPTSQQSLLRPAIVVLNAKYLPRSCDEPARVGATAFGMSVIAALRDLGVLRGVVLYSREEALSNPRTEVSTYNDTSCITVHFNFRMNPVDITEALASAFDLSSTTGDAQRPIVYYQTDVLLGFHPPHVPFAVTHHGPFVADFMRHFSARAASVAFGGADKVRVLRRQQELGVQVLAKSPNGVAFLHSTLQGRCLLTSGVSWDKCCFGLSPPIHIPKHDPSYELPPDIEAFLRNSLKSSVILFTAVARLDFFKNVSVLVDAAVCLWERGVAARLLVVGDSDDEHACAQRAELMDLIPSRYVADAIFVPRMPKPALYAFFRRIRKLGVFVCTSRYETLGITPLEAAAAGVATLVPASARVEASVWFPRQYRVAPKGAAVAARVLALLKVGAESHGAFLEGWMAKRTSEDMFRRSIALCWSRLSDRINQSTSIVA